MSWIYCPSDELILTLPILLRIFFFFSQTYKSINTKRWGLLYSNSTVLYVQDGVDLKSYTMERVRYKLKEFGFALFFTSSPRVFVLYHK